MQKVILKKYGTGNTTLIAFPGWSHPIENEKKFLYLLSKKYTVYSVCLPGYVNNQDSTFFQTFENIAKAINREIKKLQDKNLIYIGFSMGCRLIMELDNKHPNNIKKIFVGSPVKNYKLTLWAKILLMNSMLINVLRKSKQFKLFIVNKALKNITNNNEASFENKLVTLTGAFDSLIGLLKNKTSFSKYINSAQFIYGSRDNYLKEAEKIKLNTLKVIKNANHNCVRNHEAEVIKIIDAFIDNKIEKI